MKKILDQIEQFTDFLYNHHQHNDKGGDRRHQRLFVPSRTLKQNIQHSHEDPDGWGRVSHH